MNENKYKALKFTLHVQSSILPTLYDFALKASGTFNSIGLK